MDRILITGGSGFIGTNLLQYYVDQGYDVMNIDIKPPRNVLHNKLWCNCNIMDKTSLMNNVREYSPDIIFHMAARTDMVSKCVDDYHVNMMGVRNVIEVAKNIAGINRVVFSSSMLVCKLGYYPKSTIDYYPTTAYGQSKVKGEELVRNDIRGAFPWVIVRPTSVWGPWFDVPYKNFFTAIEKNIYFHPKGCEIKRSYGFIFNAIFQLSKIASCPIEQVDTKTHYLADYEPLEISIWSEMIQREFGARKIVSLPVGILRSGALMGDFLKMIGYKNPPITSFRLNNMLTNAVFDMNQLKEICGDLPFSVEEGVKLTVDWMKKS